MASETRGGVKRKQATTEEETTTTKSKIQTRVAKGKQPTNKEETAATESKTQAIGEAAKGKGKRTVAAMGKGKRTVAAMGKGKRTVAAKGKGKGKVASKGKGKGMVSAKGKGKLLGRSRDHLIPHSILLLIHTSPIQTLQVRNCDLLYILVHQLILFYSTITFTVNCVSTTFYSAVYEDYYDSDDDHYDSPLDSEFPSKGQLIEATLKEIYTIKSKGVGDAAYIALIVELKRLLKSEDTPPEVYQAAVDLMSKEIHPLKKKRVTVTEKKVTQLVHKYVDRKLKELAVAIVELQSMKDWDMEVAIFVKELADKYLKLLKLKLPNLEKLYDTADEVTKLKESSELFPGAIDTL